MTVQTATSNNATDKANRFVEYLLTSRNKTSARAALRDGDQQVLAHRALPYIAPWHYEGLALEAALLFGSVIAGNSTIRHTPGVPLGRALYRAVTAKNLSESVASSRLVTVQRQPLSLAHRTLKGLFTGLDRTRSASLDWNSVWWMYLLWDRTNPDKQRETRRQLLLDFYGSAPPPGWHVDVSSPAIQHQTPTYSSTPTQLGDSLS